MTKQILTLKDWQASFKSKSMPGTSTKKETDEFDARIERIIADSHRFGKLEYQCKIQSALYQIDRACASVATELVRRHCSEEVYEPFNEAWSELKKLIWEIENGENNEKENQQ